MEIEAIAYIHTDFSEKFGIPRQSGRVPTLAKIVFEPKYRAKEAFREIEDFSHLWLLFDFSKAHRDGFSPTVRPPRLGGNRRVGVFASRSPFRPNNIGLSSVKLIGMEYGEDGPVLTVEGADLLDMTPIYDVKPYIPSSDCHPDAKGGYSDEFTEYRLKVSDEKDMLDTVPKEIRDRIKDCIAEDPRPSYNEDGERIYGMSFAGFNVKFKVRNDTAEILEVKNI